MKRETIQHLREALKDFSVKDKIDEGRHWVKIQIDLPDETKEKLEYLDKTLFRGEIHKKLHALTSMLPMRGLDTCDDLTVCFSVALWEGEQEHKEEDPECIVYLSCTICDEPQKTWRVDF